jgi:hypothetical protein
MVMTKTMHIAEFKARFSEVTEWLKQGIAVRVIKGRSGEVVGVFKQEDPEPPKERKLGALSHLGLDISLEDLQWSDQELDEMGF